MLENNSPILVVDDDPAIRTMVKMVLQLEGYSITEAGTSQEALTQAEKNPPQAVLLDVMMPESELDGYKLCKLFRENPKTSSSVIVFVSSLNKIDSKIQGLQVGADDFMTKPFEPNELLARLKAHLRRMMLQQEKEKMLENLTEKLATANKKLQEEAFTDSLTGLYNRRFFWKQFEDEYQRAKRFGRPLSFVLIDLDRFKEVNDQYGHLTGDKVLRSVGKLLRSQLRGIDLIARVGGEEFGIILPETPLQSATLVVERLRLKCNALEVAPMPRGGVSLSAGLATFPDDGESLQELYEKADRALYTAKAHGRNCVVASH